MGTGPLRPLGVAHWELINIALHIRLHLPDVEPSTGPVLHIHVQLDGDVLTHHPVQQLQIGAASHPISPLDFEAEEMAEQIEMRKDSHIRFTKIGKNCNVQYGVQGKIA